MGLATKLLGERPTMEHVLLVLFLGVGVYMYVGASEFASDAATFPRLLAGATVVFSVLLLARNYLPGPIRSFVAEPMQVLGEDEMDATEGADGEGSEPAESAETGASGGYTYDIDDPRGPAVTGALCVLYMGLTFVVGMLYATPIFVAAYAIWARMELPRAGALTVLSFATAYAFYALISGDIAIGWYTGWRLPVP
ncbi:tripartite tricarboxylate transporter TctB family protein [Halalkalicoccus tibetensis]|uniref:Tripartite tricarboxylate transporter TctB family protein n=1 Tax=Halalkalicoccus tibetensis TaxID=175632 RepID=A0ABD5UYN3_9EURY